MNDWVDLVASGDITTILIVLAVLLVTGGLGASVVTGFVASRRGVKGDALAKESNAISGLGKLTDGQDAFITQLRTEFDSYKKTTDDKLNELETRLNNEVEYSNTLVALLIEKGIAPIPRPRHAIT